MDKNNLPGARDRGHICTQQLVARLPIWASMAQRLTLDRVFLRQGEPCQYTFGVPMGSHDALLEPAVGLQIHIWLP